MISFGELCKAVGLIVIVLCGFLVSYILGLLAVSFFRKKNK